MIRISGVTLPPNKKIYISLSYLYGIGQTLAKKILADLKIDPDTRTKDLKEEEANKIREKVEKNYRVEGDLRREILSNIKRLKEIGSYRGSRHHKGLPARGQRTKTNSRTVRGNTRRTMGSGKRKSADKT
ncbi:MAG TPA: 30S ribosomal protein S13 [Candidatus Magasanikbacteria bacterium]|nr:30S ribosomal protein S13 [Candidatus Magasanikbacteria bacterium]